MSPVQRTPAELAHLRWAGSIVFAGYGARIGVRFTDRSLGDRLAQMPSPGTHLAAAGPVDRVLSIFRRDGRYWIYGDDEMKCQPVLRADLLDAFETHLRAAFAEFARRTLFVHGGVVGWQGKAVVFPGRSLAGKTTLVAELVRAGATYLSDEYAVLDEKGWVHPFAKPLSLRDAATSRQHDTPVESLGGAAGDTSLPVGLVVMTSYRGNARWRPVRLSRAEGALAIMAHTISARRWPALAISVIGELVDRAPVIRSDRSDARNVANDILAILDDLAKH